MWTRPLRSSSRKDEFVAMPMKFLDNPTGIMEHGCAHCVFPFLVHGGSLVDMHFVCMWTCCVCTSMCNVSICTIFQFICICKYVCMSACAMCVIKWRGLCAFSLIKVCALCTIGYMCTGMYSTNTCVGVYVYLSESVVWVDACLCTICFYVYTNVSLSVASSNMVFCKCVLVYVVYIFYIHV